MKMHWGNYFDERELEFEQIAETAVMSRIRPRLANFDRYRTFSRKCHGGDNEISLCARN